MQIYGKYCHIHPGVPLFMVGGENGKGEWECLECDREFWNERYRQKLKLMKAPGQTANLHPEPETPYPRID